MTVEATGRMSTDESTVGVRRVATELAVLLSRGDVRGFIRLVRPASFEELCAEERIIRDSESFVAAAGPSHMAGAARCAPPLTEQTRIGEEMNCAQLGAASSAARLPRVAKVATIVAACGSTSCDAAVASTVCANDAGMRPWPAACAQNIVRSCYRWRPNGKRKSARSAALPVYAWPFGPLSRRDRWRRCGPLRRRHRRGNRALGHANRAVPQQPQLVPSGVLQPADHRSGLSLANLSRILGIHSPPPPRRGAPREPLGLLRP